jgi:hypothetical protein
LICVRDAAIQFGVPNRSVKQVLARAEQFVSLTPRLKKGWIAATMSRATPAHNLSPGLSRATFCVKSISYALSLALTAGVC